MSTSIYVVFYLITCVSTEIHLGFINARTDQVEYSNVSDNFGIFKMTTGSIVKAGDNETVEVNLGTNTILCSKDFDKFRSLEYVLINATNVVEIETNFLQGKRLVTRLVIFNGEIHTIKRHNFHNLEIRSLILSGNKITTIEEEAFVNLSRLKIIFLDRNQLKELNPKSFVGLLQLDEFRAGGNEISKLQKSVFEFLEIRKAFIDLSSNCIETVDKGVFDGSNATNVILFLEFNRIRFFPPEIFQHHRFVRVDRYNSSISKISPKYFEIDFNLTFLNLDCNPLDEETLQAFSNWRTENNVVGMWFPCSSGHRSGNMHCHPIFVTLAMLLISYESNRK
jgi:Leucine-rich repeat (LRR) protein